MPRVDFSREAIPAFAEAPSVVLVTGDVGFFVEEKAGEVLEKLRESDAEVLRFDDEATSDAVSDSILNRSLFSPRRVVTVDIGRLLGTDSPAVLLGKAIDAWDKGTPPSGRGASRARALAPGSFVSCRRRRGGAPGFRPRSACSWSAAMRGRSWS